MNKNSSKVNTLKDIKSIDSLIAGMDLCEFYGKISKKFVDDGGYNLSEFIYGQKLGRKNKYKKHKNSK